MSRLMLKRGLVAETNPKSPVSEAFRTLRTNMDIAVRKGGLKCIAVTSALPGEGKSTAAANLAATYAQANRRVLLIDANMRGPVQHQIFGLSNHDGLSTALNKSGGDVREFVRTLPIDRLHVMCAGPIPPNPAELLDSEAMTALLEKCKEVYDIIIMDTPAVTPFADALVAAGKSDGAVLIVGAGKVGGAMAIKAKASLAYGNANLIGAVLNRIGR